MKLILTAIFSFLILPACTHLTAPERDRLQELKCQGISIDKPQTQWEKPANPAAAGALNLLPGFGNFYLASGNGGDSSHYLFGALNLITWPFSVLWGIPEAVIDAETINKRELLYHYQYNLPKGKSS